MPNISIALATYNGAAFLASQLQSLAAQSHLPFELVVTDDQSSDDTVRIIESFAASAPFPVRIHVNDARLGWRANFVKAVGLCQGDLISLCDQDDVWYPDKLATVTAAFTDPSVLLVYHNADLIDEQGTAYSTLMPIAATSQRIVPLSRPTDWSNPLGLVMTFRRWLTALRRPMGHIRRPVLAGQPGGARSMVLLPGHQSGPSHRVAGAAARLSSTRSELRWLDACFGAQTAARAGRDPSSARSRDQHVGSVQPGIGNGSRARGR